MGCVSRQMKGVAGRRFAATRQRPEGCGSGARPPPEAGPARPPALEACASLSDRVLGTSIMLEGGGRAKPSPPPRVRRRSLSLAGGALRLLRLVGLTGSGADASRRLPYVGGAALGWSPSRRAPVSPSAP